MKDREYRRDLTVPVTEDFLVLTTLKVPAGVKLSSILVSPEPNPYGEYLRMFISLDTKVIYNGRYISDGLNIQVDDGLYEKDRVLIFSLSPVGYDPIEIRDYLETAQLKISIIGTYLSNYVIMDEHISFEDSFNKTWC